MNSMVKHVIDHKNVILIHYIFYVSYTLEHAGHPHRCRAARDELFGLK